MEHQVNYGGYGATYPLQKCNMGYYHGPRRGLHPVALCLCFFAPWVIFAVNAALLSFSVHYNQPGLCAFGLMLTLALVLLFGYLAYVQYKARSDSYHWYIFLFVTSLLAWVISDSVGQGNFTKNMQPYYDVINLNVYPSVDPQLVKGQQLMDAGQINFTLDSRLDLVHSMGFRNVDAYCVAPVVSGNGSMTTYDFWAVGINCCSGHTADFMCGEFNNPSAHMGLRLMRDDLRPYYRLAVQQAEAAYNIKAAHPIFLYFMTNSQFEINAYQDAGFKYYLTAILIYFAVQIFLVVAAVLLFSKLNL